MSGEIEELMSRMEGTRVNDDDPYPILESLSSLPEVADKHTGDDAKEHENVDKGFASVEILPEEVWHLVFNKLQPKELAAAYQAEPTFQRLLVERRSTWLFSLTLSQLESELSSKDLLSCRRVCRQWKSRVEEFFQSPSQLLRMDSLNLDAEIGVTVFKSVASVEKFTSLFVKQSGTVNPFLTRIVRIREPLPVEDFGHEDDHAFDVISRFWNGMEIVLEKFGEEIDHCHLFIPSPLPIIYAGQLRYLLYVMTSLVSLEFRSDMQWPFFIGDDNVEEPNDEKMPALPKLEELIIYNVPPTLTWMLLRAAGPTSLRRIAMTSALFVDSDGVPTDFEDIAGMFSNLDQFFWNSVPTSLAGLERATWPLTTLFLNLVLGSSPGVVTLEDLFTAVNTFGGTLVMFEMDARGNFCYDATGATKKLRLLLPHLESFILCTGPVISIESLDFVTELKNLK